MAKKLRNKKSNFIQEDDELIKEVFEQEKEDPQYVRQYQESPHDRRDYFSIETEDP